MSSNLVDYVVSKEFERALRDLVVEDKTQELITPNRLLSGTPPFPYSKKILEAKKSVFNYVACDNELEYSFARFLDESEDIEAFAKLPEQFGFSIEYPDSLSNIRNYFPDFVAKAVAGTHWIIETTGREDIEVRRKDEAAKRWCESATSLTGVDWKYLKVPQKEFEGLHHSTFGDLTEALTTAV